MRASSHHSRRGTRLAPLGSKAADLVVWWEEGFYPQEDAAVKEVVAAFEQGSGKQVEPVFLSKEELPDRSWRGWKRVSRPTSPSGSAPRHLGMGLRRSASGPVGRSVTFRTCSIRRARLWVLLNQRRARGRFTGCRWAARPTPSTSGRAS